LRPARSRPSSGRRSKERLGHAGGKKCAHRLDDLPKAPGAHISSIRLGEFNWLRHADTTYLSDLRAGFSLLQDRDDLL
jgi:hypothetical protein